MDVIIVTETNQRFLERLDPYFGELVDALRTGVDLLVYTPAEFEKMREGPFVARALAEGKIVYES